MGGAFGQVGDAGDASEQIDGAWRQMPGSKWVMPADRWGRSAEKVCDTQTGELHWPAVWRLG